jgi:hypothetical protein
MVPMPAALRFVKNLDSSDAFLSDALGAPSWPGAREYLAIIVEE